MHKVLFETAEEGDGLKCPSVALVKINYATTINGILLFFKRMKQTYVVTRTYA